MGKKSPKSTQKKAQKKQSVSDCRTEANEDYSNNESSPLNT